MKLKTSRLLLALVTLMVTFISPQAFQTPETASTVQKNQQNPSERATPSPSNSPADALPANERYEYDKLRLQRDLQKELVDWAQTRFWTLAVLIVLVGFFGIRALVREMIASELKEAARAAAQAEAAAEQTIAVTKQVRADADSYRGMVAELSDTATQVDERFKALDARISAEAAHAVASSDLQLSQLADHVEELSQVVKTLASESQENWAVLQKYDQRIKELDRTAVSKRAKFSENSQYLIEVVSHPANEESIDFADKLVKSLTTRGYRASSGRWAPTQPNEFNSVRIKFKGHVPQTLIERVKEIIQSHAEENGLSLPIFSGTGLHRSFSSDVAVFLE